MAQFPRILETLRPFEVHLDTTALLTAMRAARFLATTAVLLLICGLLVACSDDKPSSTPTAARSTPAANASTARSTPSSAATAPPTTAASICQANPAPHPANLRPADFGFRELDRPRASDAVRSPLVVEGRANPFEGAYSVTIFDASGRQIATRNLTKDNQALAFTAQVPFQVTSPTPACVWVHERSGRDGSPTNVTQVPVQLLP